MEDFIKSAYGFGEAGDYLFYEDSGYTTLLELSSVTVPAELYQGLTIYVADSN